MRPTKKQRNQLLPAVADSRMPITEFEMIHVGFDAPPTLDEAGGSWALQITHTPSESKFDVSPKLAPSDLSLSRSPPLRTYSSTLLTPSNERRRRSTPDKELYAVHWIVATDTQELKQASAWADVVASATTWAQDVADYVETPDLWDQLQAQRQLIAEGAFETLDNTPFTLDEKRQISAQFRNLKKHIRETQPLTGDQFSRLEARIDEAEAASSRLGRKDWMLLFMGTMVTFVNDLVPSSDVQLMVTSVLHGIGHMFGLGMPPLPLG